MALYHQRVLVLLNNPYKKSTAGSAVLFLWKPDEGSR